VQVEPKSLHYLLARLTIHETLLRIYPLEDRKPLRKNTIFEFECIFIFIPTTCKDSKFDIICIFHDRYLSVIAEHELDGPFAAGQMRRFRRLFHHHNYVSSEKP
jgi:hypothetical protein